MPSFSKMLQTDGKPLPHVGKMVQQLLTDRHITPTEMARRMGISDTSFMRSLQQPTLQAAVLWKLGQLLNHNFFVPLAQEHPVPVPPTDKQKELEQQVADLQKENQLYQKVLAALNVKL
jgi:transcriptional regulator with XRE-family HTH domain